MYYTNLGKDVLGSKNQWCISDYVNKHVLDCHKNNLPFRFAGMAVIEKSGLGFVCFWRALLSITTSRTHRVRMNSFLNNDYTLLRLITAILITILSVQQI
jgi:hypothetical protein